MTKDDEIRLAQVIRDKGSLSEDAFGIAGELAFVLRLLREATEWRDIATLDHLFDLVLLSNNLDCWIGYRRFGEDSWEWGTNEEDMSDLVPTKWLPLPAPPKAQGR